MISIELRFLFDRIISRTSASACDEKHARHDVLLYDLIFLYLTEKGFTKNAMGTNKVMGIYECHWIEHPKNPRSAEATSLQSGTWMVRHDDRPARLLAHEAHKKRKLLIFGGHPDGRCAIDNILHNRRELSSDANWRFVIV